MGHKYPGPTCASRPHDPIDDGTSIRIASCMPGPTGAQREWQDRRPLRRGVQKTATGPPVSGKISTQPKVIVDSVEHQLTELNADENALVTEIEKVRKDIAAWEDVGFWLWNQRHRAVSIEETKERYNQRRWLGQSKKVGGIDPNAGYEPVIDPDFRANNRPVIIEGYELHERVHRNETNNLDLLSATFSYTFKGGKRWESNWYIGYELRAHRAQKEFYEDALNKVRAEKTKLKR